MARSIEQQHHDLAQLLLANLKTIHYESRRNSELRGAIEEAMKHLSQPNPTQNTFSSDVVLRPIMMIAGFKLPNTIMPVLAVFQHILELSPTPRVAQTAISSIAILVDDTAANAYTTGNATQDDKIYVKVLQCILLAVTPNILNNGDGLRTCYITALSICCKLSHKPKGIIQNTALAAVRHLIQLLFDTSYRDLQEQQFWTNYPFPHDNPPRKTQTKLHTKLQQRQRGDELDYEIGLDNELQDALREFSDDSGSDSSIASSLSHCSDSSFTLQPMSNKFSQSRTSSTHGDDDDDDGDDDADSSPHHNDSPTLKTTPQKEPIQTSASNLEPMSSNALKQLANSTQSPPITPTPKPPTQLTNNAQDNPSPSPGPTTQPTIPPKFHPLLPSLSLSLTIFVELCITARSFVSNSTSSPPTTANRPKSLVTPFISTLQPSLCLELVYGVIIKHNHLFISLPHFTRILSTDVLTTIIEVIACDNNALVLWGIKLASVLLLHYGGIPSLIAQGELLATILSRQLYYTSNIHVLMSILELYQSIASNARPLLVLREIYDGSQEGTDQQTPGTTISPVVYMFLKSVGALALQMIEFLSGNKLKLLPSSLRNQNLELNNFQLGNPDGSMVGVNLDEALYHPALDPATGKPVPPQQLQNNQNFDTYPLNQPNNAIALSHTPASYGVVNGHDIWDIRRCVVNHKQVPSTAFGTPIHILAVCLEIIMSFCHTLSSLTQSLGKYENYILPTFTELAAEANAEADKVNRARGQIEIEPEPEVEMDLDAFVAKSPNPDGEGSAVEEMSMSALLGDSASSSISNDNANRGDDEKDGDQDSASLQSTKSSLSSGSRSSQISNKSRSPSDIEDTDDESEKDDEDNAGEEVSSEINVEAIKPQTPVHTPVKQTTPAPKPAPVAVSKEDPKESAYGEFNDGYHVRSVTKLTRQLLQVGYTQDAFSFLSRFMSDLGYASLIPPNTDPITGNPGTTSSSPESGSSTSEPVKKYKKEAKDELQSPINPNIQPHYLSIMSCLSSLLTTPVIPTRRSLQSLLELLAPTLISIFHHTVIYVKHQQLTQFCLLGLQSLINVSLLLSGPGFVLTKQASGDIHRKIIPPLPGSSMYDITKEIIIALCSLSLPIHDYSELLYIKTQFALFGCHSEETLSSISGKYRYQSSSHTLQASNGGKSGQIDNGSSGKVTNSQLLFHEDSMSSTVELPNGMNNQHFLPALCQSSKSEQQPYREIIWPPKIYDRTLSNDFLAKIYEFITPDITQVILSRLETKDVSLSRPLTEFAVFSPSQYVLPPPPEEAKGEEDGKRKKSSKTKQTNHDLQYYPPPIPKIQGQTATSAASSPNTASNAPTTAFDAPTLGDFFRALSLNFCHIAALKALLNTAHVYGKELGQCWVPILHTLTRAYSITGVWNSTLTINKPVVGTNLDLTTYISSQTVGELGAIVLATKSLIDKNIALFTKTAKNEANKQFYSHQYHYEQFTKLAKIKAQRLFHLVFDENQNLVEVDSLPSNPQALTLSPVLAKSPAQSVPESPIPGRLATNNIVIDIEPEGFLSTDLHFNHIFHSLLLVNDLLHNRYILSVRPNPNITPISWNVDAAKIITTTMQTPSQLLLTSPTLLPTPSFNGRNTMQNPEDQHRQQHSLLSPFSDRILTFPLAFLLDLVETCYDSTYLNPFIIFVRNILMRLVYCDHHFTQRVGILLLSRLVCKVLRVEYNILHQYNSSIRINLQSRSSNRRLSAGSTESFDETNGEKKATVLDPHDTMFLDATLLYYGKYARDSIYLPTAANDMIAVMHQNQKSTATTPSNASRSAVGFTTPSRRSKSVTAVSLGAGSSKTQGPKRDIIKGYGYTACDIYCYALASLCSPQPLQWYNHNATNVLPSASPQPAKRITVAQANVSIPSMMLDCALYSLSCMTVVFDHCGGIIANNWLALLSPLSCSIAMLQQQQLYQQQLVQLSIPKDVKKQTMYQQTQQQTSFLPAPPPGGPVVVTKPGSPTNSSGNASSDALMTARFKVVQLICDDYLDIIPLSYVPYIINIVSTYAQQFISINTAFVSVHQLWRLSDYIQQTCDVQHANKQILLKLIDSLIYLQESSTPASQSPQKKKAFDHHHVDFTTHPALFTLINSILGSNPQRSTSRGEVSPPPVQSPAITPGLGQSGSGKEGSPTSNMVTRLSITNTTHFPSLPYFFNKYLSYCPAQIEHQHDIQPLQQHIVSSIHSLLANTTSNSKLATQTPLLPVRAATPPALSPQSNDIDEFSLDTSAIVTSPSSSNGPTPPTPTNNPSGIVYASHLSNTSLQLLLCQMLGTDSSSSSKNSFTSPNQSQTYSSPTLSHTLSTQPAHFSNDLSFRTALSPTLYRSINPQALSQNELSTHSQALQTLREYIYDYIATSTQNRNLDAGIASEMMSSVLYDLKHIISSSTTLYEIPFLEPTSPYSVMNDEEANSTFASPQQHQLYNLLTTFMHTPSYQHSTQLHRNNIQSYHDVLLYYIYYHFNFILRSNHTEIRHSAIKTLYKCFEEHFPTTTPVMLEFTMMTLIVPYTMYTIPDTLLVHCENTNTPQALAAMENAQAVGVNASNIQNFSWKDTKILSIQGLAQLLNPLLLSLSKRCYSNATSPKRASNREYNYDSLFLPQQLQPDYQLITYNNPLFNLSVQQSSIPANILNVVSYILLNALNHHTVELSLATATNINLLFNAQTLLQCVQYDPTHQLLFTVFQLLSLYTSWLQRTAIIYSLSYTQSTAKDLGETMILSIKAQYYPAVIGFNHLLFTRPYEQAIQWELYHQNLLQQQSNAGVPGSQYSIGHPTLGVPTSLVDVVYSSSNIPDRCVVWYHVAGGILDVLHTVIQKRSQASPHGSPIHNIQANPSPKISAIAPTSQSSPLTHPTITPPTLPTPQPFQSLSVITTPLKQLALSMAKDIVSCEYLIPCVSTLSSTFINGVCIRPINDTSMIQNIYLYTLKDALGFQPQPQPGSTTPPPSNSADQSAPAQAQAHNADGSSEEDNVLLITTVLECIALHLSSRPTQQYQSLGIYLDQYFQKGLQHSYFQTNQSSGSKHTSSAKDVITTVTKSYPHNLTMLAVPTNSLIDPTDTSIKPTNSTCPAYFNAIPQHLFQFNNTLLQPDQTFPYPCVSWLLLSGQSYIAKLLTLTQTFLLYNIPSSISLTQQTILQQFNQTSQPHGHAHHPTIAALLPPTYSTILPANDPNPTRRVDVSNQPGSYFSNPALYSIVFTYMRLFYPIYQHLLYICFVSNIHSHRPAHAQHITESTSPANVGAREDTSSSPSPNNNPNSNKSNKDSNAASLFTQLSTITLASNSYTRVTATHPLLRHLIPKSSTSSTSVNLGQFGSVFPSTQPPVSQPSPAAPPTGPTSGKFQHDTFYFLPIITSLYINIETICIILNKYFPVFYQSTPIDTQLYVFSSYNLDLPQAIIHDGTASLEHSGQLLQSYPFALNIHTAYTLPTLYTTYHIYNQLLNVTALPLPQSSTYAPHEYNTLDLCVHQLYTIITNGLIIYTKHILPLWLRSQLDIYQFLLLLSDAITINNEYFVPINAQYTTQSQLLNHSSPQLTSISTPPTPSLTPPQHQQVELNHLPDVSSLYTLIYEQRFHKSIIDTASTRDLASAHSLRDDSPNLSALYTKIWNLRLFILSELILFDQVGYADPITSLASPPTSVQSSTTLPPLHLLEELDPLEPILAPVDKSFSELTPESTRSKDAKNAGFVVAINDSNAADDENSVSRDASTAAIDVETDTSLSEIQPEVLDLEHSSSNPSPTPSTQSEAAPLVKTAQVLPVPLSTPPEPKSLLGTITQPQVHTISILASYLYVQLVKHTLSTYTYGCHYISLPTSSHSTLDNMISGIFASPSTSSAFPTALSDFSHRPTSSAPSTTSSFSLSKSTAQSQQQQQQQQQQRDDTSSCNVFAYHSIFFKQIPMPSAAEMEGILLRCSQLSTSQIVHDALIVQNSTFLEQYAGTALPKLYQPHLLALYQHLCEVIVSPDYDVRRIVLKLLLNLKYKMGNGIF